MKLELERSELVTLLSTITMSMAINVQDQLPPHALIARKAKALENAIRDLAKCNAQPLDEELIQAGVKAWNSAIRTIQSELNKPFRQRDEKGRFRRVGA